VKSLSEYGEIVNMPKEISTLRKQSELNVEDDSNENETSTQNSNGNRNRSHNESQNGSARHENATIETIEEQEEEYEREG